MGVTMGNLATWIVVLALPVWLLVEEIAHRLPALKGPATSRVRRQAEARPAPAGRHRVTADNTAHA